MRIPILLVALTAASLQLVAQQPALEAVSVKPNVGVSVARNNTFSPGRTILINYAPAVLIQDAYGSVGYQLVSLPDGARTERVDVEATYPPGTPRPVQM